MAVALHHNTKTLHHTSHRSGPHLDPNNTAIDRDRIGNQVHVTGREPKGAP
jgi:hypothetical protein